jgi:hypothetical protein
MGERGRSAFLANHERRICCGQWHELIAELTALDAGAARPARVSPRRSVARTTAAAMAALAITPHLR